MVKCIFNMFTYFTVCMCINVGVANPSVLHHSLYDKLGLNRDIDYHRLGIIYFDENHRGKGYGALALKEFIKIHKNVIYITHASNDISNAIAQKHLTYYKDHYSWHNYKVYYPLKAWL